MRVVGCGVVERPCTFAGAAGGERLVCAALFNAFQGDALYCSGLHLAACLELNGCKDVFERKWHLLLVVSDVWVGGCHYDVLLVGGKGGHFVFERCALGASGCGGESCVGRRPGKELQGAVLARPVTYLRRAPYGAVGICGVVVHVELRHGSAVVGAVRLHVERVVGFERRYGHSARCCRPALERSDVYAVGNNGLHAQGVVGVGRTHYEARGGVFAGSLGGVGKGRAFCHGLVGCGYAEADVVAVLSAVGAAVVGQVIAGARKQQQACGECGRLSCRLV